MLDKMTPNQRLILAVGLSFLFFVAYTTIFPPENPVIDTNATSKQAQKVAQPSSTDNTAQPVKTFDDNSGHQVASDERRGKSETANLVTVNAEHFTMAIDTLGRISSKAFKDEKFYDANGNPAQMIAPFGAKPLYIRFADDVLNEQAARTPYVASTHTIDLVANASGTLTLTQTLSDVTVTKKLTLYRDGHYDITVELNNEKRYFIYLGQRPNVTDQMMTVKGAMVYSGDNMTTIFEDGDVEGRTAFTDVHLASAFDQYFASIFYGLTPDTLVMVERDRDDNPVVYIDASRVMSFNGYVGPKEYLTLESIDPVLVNAIEYGWFTFAAAPLFTFLLWLYNFFGNWGWAIVALTIVIRLILYPLTYKGMLSMQKMKDLAPRVKELQAKYKGDPQRMNAAMMEMYRKHGANPLGGCFPLLLQIPVFFAIYRVLLNAVELQGAEWILWIDDLSRMDPYIILPILMGASMYYQQKLTPNNFTDPMQQKIFQFLPVIFTFFFITFPSGLVLYWLVNNLFSIVQQFIVNAKYEKIKAERHEQHLQEKHKHDKN